MLTLATSSLPITGRIAPTAATAIVLAVNVLTI
jgi:hypothetical protein